MAREGGRWNYSFVSKMAEEAMRSCVMLLHIVTFSRADLHNVVDWFGLIKLKYSSNPMEQHTNGKLDPCLHQRSKSTGGFPL